MSYLRGLVIFGRFSAILHYREILYLPFCLFANKYTYEKGSTLKGKNLLPMGVNSFPFGVDLISRGRQNNFHWAHFGHPRGAKFPHGDNKYSDKTDLNLRFATTLEGPFFHVAANLFSF